jgi:hypothetical protein
VFFNILYPIKYFYTHQSHFILSYFKFGSNSNAENNGSTQIFSLNLIQRKIYRHSRSQSGNICYLFQLYFENLYRYGIFHAFKVPINLQSSPSLDLFSSTNQFCSQSLFLALLHTGKVSIEYRALMISLEVK